MCGRGVGYFSRASSAKLSFTPAQSDGSQNHVQVQDGRFTEGLEDKSNE